ncbi:MAG: helix-turn-helix domain-containing protein [Lachnospiraceae bacterium]|nr:helix-turn-helix domain-containing protein [Lachnospiraceae bacterium]
MTIQSLVNQLQDIIIKAFTPIPYYSIEEGIRFLFPACNTVSGGTLFAGTYSEWKTLCSNHQLQLDCTYLISITNEKPYELVCPDTQLNVLFIGAPINIIRKRLTLLFMEMNEQLHYNDISTQYIAFWDDIISFALTDRTQILQRFDDFPFPLHKHIACIVARPVISSLNSYEIQKIQNGLQDFFPNINLFYTGAEWIVLYSQTKDTSDILDFSYDSFSALLEQYQLDAGISYSCQIPELLRTLYITASISIELGKKLSITPYTKRIYTYHQYNPYYVIHLCSQKFTELHNTDNLIYLTHPDITRLYYYDLENNSNLLDVLFAYISYGKNLTLTAQQLYMHRNTVLKKLKKIEEFLEHKLDYDTDQLLLLLSCIILKYQIYYTHRPLQDFFTEGIANDETE